MLVSQQAIEVLVAMLGEQTCAVLLDKVVFLDHASSGAKLNKSKHAVQELILPFPVSIFILYLRLNSLTSHTSFLRKTPALTGIVFSQE